MLKVASSLNELDFDRMFGSGVPLGAWMWCLHCERVFKLGEYREVRAGRCSARMLQYCPYDGCCGSPLDWQTWGDIREHHVDYPAVPDRDKEYPLY